MNILVLALILASAFLGVLVFMSPNKSKKESNQQNDPVSQKGTIEDSQKALILTLEDQLFSAKDELEKVKAACVNIQQELEVSKKRELDLREELMRQKDWYDKKVNELDALKNDYFPIKDKLDKEISQDLNLNKEIKEKDSVIEALKKSNEELTVQIRSLKAQT